MQVPGLLGEQHEQWEAEQDEGGGKTYVSSCIKMEPPRVIMFIDTSFPRFEHRI